MRQLAIRLGKTQNRILDRYSPGDFFLPSSLIASRMLVGLVKLRSRFRKVLLIDPSSNRNEVLDVIMFDSHATEEPIGIYITSCSLAPCLT